MCMSLTHSPCFYWNKSRKGLITSSGCSFSLKDTESVQDNRKSPSQYFERWSWKCFWKPWYATSQGVRWLRSFLTLTNLHSHSLVSLHKELAVLDLSSGHASFLKALFVILFDCFVGDESHSTVPGIKRYCKSKVLHSFEYALKMHYFSHFILFLKRLMLFLSL